MKTSSGNVGGKQHRQRRHGSCIARSKHNAKALFSSPGNRQPQYPACSQFMPRRHELKISSSSINGPCFMSLSGTQPRWRACGRGERIHGVGVGVLFCKHSKAKSVLFSCLKTVGPMTFLPHPFVTGEQDRVAA